MKTVKLGKIKIGGRNPMVLIAGPCVIEDERTTMRHAKKLKEMTDRIKIPFIFKSQPVSLSQIFMYRPRINTIKVENHRNS